MAARGDIGHNETEYLLKRMELRISREYAKAAVEIEDKLKDYMRRFAIKDELKQKGVAAGILTEQEYKNWRIGQIAIGKRWEEMKNTIAQDLTNAAKIAGSITNSYMPDVYAVNHNYGTFQVEKLSRMDTSYTLYDRQTVERMFRDEEKFYHAPGKKVSRAIAEGKQLAWDKKLVQSVMTQSLLQGESVSGIATRLAQAVGDRDRKACIRNARTMATGVQNAGRVDSYKRAENMGIELQQEWLATIDGRTRHEHRLLDGQRVKVGEKFKVEGYELEYPADPNGEPEMVYNCRCTLIPALKGHEVDTSNISLRNTDHALEKEYQEWKKSRNIHSDPITKQDEIAARMRAVYGAEYARYTNADVSERGDLESGISNKKGSEEGLVVDLDYINSNEYKRKFSDITGNTKVDEAIYKYAKAGLTHRSGTNREDLFIISSTTGKLLGKNTSSDIAYGVNINKSVKNAILNNQGDLIGLHTHPDGTPPTGSDFATSMLRRYNIAITACADGSVHIYKHSDQAISAKLIDDTIEKFQRRIDNEGKKIYNSNLEAHKIALKQLQKDWGIYYEEKK